ncbi:DUF418 domain-containing protein [Nosocomiicoccus massiliensis]|uniref:DUF418 domain-containing protein n=1 Tax=Nosocomiicoccus massiliensis TaxID=1232430 RepID=UPI00042611DE|nr:DUF418 domain-containing protein [Nosocomiicoccus massiliensis]
MKRIKVIDSLRGFSLLGILLANLLIFHYGMFGNQYPEVYNVSKFGEFLIHIIRIFFEGSTMPIFAFLFGFGMYMMSESFTKKDLGVKRALLRRGIGLIVLGLLHGAFFFEGDILFLYGLITLLIFWLPKRSVKTMVVTMVLSVILLIYMFTKMDVESLHMIKQSFGGPLTDEKIEYLIQEKEVYSTGTLSERNIFASDFSDHPFMPIDDMAFLYMLLFGIIFYIPIFISGMLAAKLKVFVTGGAWKKWLVLLVPIGLLINVLAEFGIFQDYILFGDFALSYGYIALFYYLYKENLFMDSLAAVGKLSLTNYILQSVFHSFIYYGSGLGRFGDGNFTLSFTLAILFFIVQIICSHYYMKKFKYGPLEYILRIWTYFSFKPHLKRGKNAHI